MLVVLINDIYLAKNHREIILFDNQNDINFFLQQFFQYAVNKAAQMGGTFIFDVMNAQNNVKIEEYDSNNLRWKNCKTCLWNDIKKEKGL